MVKLKNIMKIGILTLIMILILTIQSHAAIQIVPTSSVLTNVTVSTSYKTCRDLDSLSSTLGTTKLDPHLVTNKDWGAVSYLANSAYGVNAIYDTDSGEGKVGKLISINNANYYSTTPNATGVMNWGGNPNKTMYTQTSGILDNANSISINDANIVSNVQIILDNKNTKYVDRLINNSTIGMAIQETSNWGAYYQFSTSNLLVPICVRAGLFAGVWIGSPNNEGWRTNSNVCSGGKFDLVTFRPVIWNIE